jgi:hypothetical protein
MKINIKKTKYYLRTITPPLLNFLLWTSVILIGLFVSHFIIDRLNITNNFLIVLITAFIISVFMELIRSHNERYYFKKNWVFFYFLIISVTLWAFNDFIFIDFLSQNVFKQLLIVSIVLSATIILLRSISERATLPGVVCQEARQQVFFQL